MLDRRQPIAMGLQGAVGLQFRETPEMLEQPTAQRLESVDLAAAGGHATPGLAEGQP